MSKCPTCKKSTDPEYKPFCSKRCADLDLGKWLNEDYKLPGNTDLEGWEQPNQSSEDY